MSVRIFRTLVNAEPQIVWSALMDSLENPQKYSPEIRECRVVKTAEDEFLREIQIADVCYKEKVFINNAAKEISREFVDDPAFSGKIVVKVVPTSVQNPMAPIDLQYFVELDVKWKEENLIISLMDEQKRLKEVSEELEKNESRVSQEDRRFHHPP